jgi:hypothetical protein
MEHGATTQSIQNVGVGTYWVKLKTGECVATQKVTVYPSEQPVVTNIDVTNTTLTVNVIGGTPDYQYSLDKIIGRILMYSIIFQEVLTKYM